MCLLILIVIVVFVFKKCGGMYIVIVYDILFGFVVSLKMSFKVKFFIMVMKKLEVWIFNWVDSVVVFLEVMKFYLIEIGVIFLIVIVLFYVDIDELFLSGENIGIDFVLMYSGNIGCK